MTAMFRMAEEGEEQLCPVAPPAADAHARSEGMRRLPDVVARFLSDMDRKLDAILGLLQRESLARDFPHQGRVTRISAEQVVLECREPLAPGDLLELALMRDHAPLASGIARVDGARQRSVDGGSAPGAYDVSFVRLRADDREAIIRCIFQENRRIIRQSRELS
jgi:hypothetical protein